MLTHMNLLYEGLTKQWLTDRADRAFPFGWLVGYDSAGHVKEYNQFSFKNFDKNIAINLIPRTFIRTALDLVGGILGFMGDNWDDGDKWNKVYHEKGTWREIMNEGVNLAVDASLIIVIIVVFFIVLKRRIMKIIPNFTRALSVCFGFIYLKRKVK